MLKIQHDIEKIKDEIYQTFELKDSLTFLQATTEVMTEIIKAMIENKTEEKKTD